MCAVCVHEQVRARQGSVPPIQYAHLIQPTEGLIEPSLFLKESVSFEEGTC